MIGIDDRDGPASSWSDSSDGVGIAPRGLLGQDIDARKRCGGLEIIAGEGRSARSRLLHGGLRGDHESHVGIGANTTIIRPRKT